MTQSQLLAAAEEKQRRAADPGLSAWVRANAGTGKTHVLVQRILRLLLTGAEPRSILCLTFTKNAAAEMEARVLAKLGEWATASDATLGGLLAKTLTRAPEASEIALARCLFATVIDAPGGLAIMTIHSFCERVLRRYSLEANVPPGFTVLTEEEAREALKEACAGAFASASEGPLRAALECAAAYAREDEFARVLDAMLGKRLEIAHLFSLTPEAEPLPAIEARLRRLFNVAAADTKDSLLARAASVLNSQALAEAAGLLNSGSANDTKSAARFEAALKAAGNGARCAALKNAFATGKGEPRASLMTKGLRERAPALFDRLVAAQDAFLDLDAKISGLKAVEASAALLRLTEAIFVRYEAAKRGRTALDFGDLIAQTLRLLSRQEATEWVLYELDSRIDHILIDEAQDTSPEQWQIVERLTSDFFAGQGQRDCVPTLFAVGDEKQSIYGFQGARPELLAAFGTLYEEQVSQAGYSWCTSDLNLSFRTLAPILDAVDDVSGALPGLRQGDGARHLAYRAADGGLVELWEPEQGEKQEKGSVWEPDAEAAPAPKPAETLAARIAAQIRHWLDSGEGLASRGRAIEPGDILILLRKRQPMAKLLQAALKREGVPVAGTDRIALTDELAVMDLLVLADALLQPEDDLALGVALKGPLFGLGEDDLYKLAHGREGSLWQALERDATGANLGLDGAMNGGRSPHPVPLPMGEGTLPHAPGAIQASLLPGGEGQDEGRERSSSRNQAGDGAAASRPAVADKLARWRELARKLSPFDFYAHILEAEGGRKAFGARLGAECFDAIDEFLALAETFSARPLASLAEFVSFARKSASEVKRETDQAAREVRIMTVHGAKGLEADIVILADTCGNKSASPVPVYFLDDNSGAPAIPVWSVKGTSGLRPIADAKEDIKAGDLREQGRLLYVAMTRARDRLYIAGFHNGSLPAASWYATIHNALVPELLEARDFEGRTVWRTGPWQVLSAPALDAAKAEGEGLPAWLAAPAPKQAPPTVLSPSRIMEAAGAGPATFAPMSEAERKTAQARGSLIHRLLEVLPALPPEHRVKAARLASAAYSGELAPPQREEAARHVLALIAKGALAPQGGRILAEAGLGVTVPGAGGEPGAVILGQADRIELRDGAAAVLDYKSGSLPADGPAKPAHLAQLACYRLALQRLYPDADVHAAIFDTSSGNAREAPGQDLDAVLMQVLAGFAASR
jgi:ATP-dependent helicase/nuclease subunit A